MGRAVDHHRGNTSVGIRFEPFDTKPLGVRRPPIVAVPGLGVQCSQVGLDDHNEATGCDARRLSAIVADANRQVASYIGRVTQNHDERRDLFADITMRAWVGRRELFAAADPTLALIAHARDACREWAHCRRREVPLSNQFELPDLEANDETSISVDDAVRWFEWSNRVLSKLSDKQRLAVDYHCRWNWSYEVAFRAFWRVTFSKLMATINLWKSCWPCNAIPKLQRIQIRVCGGAANNSIAPLPASAFAIPQAADD